MGKAVRLADIGKALGISAVSVSKALAGKPGVSEDMRRKVVKLAREMGYEGVKSRAEAEPTGNIGVLVARRFFEENSFYFDLYRQITLAVGAAGCSCILEVIQPEMERSGDMPVMLTEHKVDGAILMGDLAEDYFSRLENCGIPCILLDFQRVETKWDCVVGDNLNGGYLLTRHLLQTGHTKIGYVGSIFATSSIMSRYLGYHKALQLAGIEPRTDWRLEDRDEDGNFITPVMPSEMPEAFVCNNDEVAMKLIEQLRERGCRVPEDVAVCGYDDSRFAQLSDPPLTTYRVDIGRMAKIAVDRLAERFSQPEYGPLIFTVPGQIVIRQSSGAAKKLT